MADEHDRRTEDATSFSDVPVSGKHHSRVSRREQLAEAERRLETLIRNMPGIAYRCRNDQAWTMEWLSEGCESLTGYLPEDLVGNRTLAFADLIVPNDRERVWTAVQSSLAAAEPYQIEYCIETKSGDTKWVWEQGVGIREGGEVVALEGIIHDVTQRHVAEHQREEMEHQMRAAQRMESIGRLAGGVAHDFNNLLSVILSYARFLKDALHAEDPARSDVDMIEEAAARAAHLTNQLLAFSRRQPQELTVVRLNDIVAGLDKMLRRLIGEDIDLVTTLGDEAGHVTVDVTQMEQVLMNLVINARDAMPKGGKLTIETRNVWLDEHVVADVDAEIAAGAYILLAVTDSGIGIEEQVRSKIFEPFYTTKDKSKGTGLGLSTVYGIVMQSGGYIEVDSELGQGTTFRIYLPRAQPPRKSTRARRLSPRSMKGIETILLVEDDGAVRRAAARILRRAGYEVIEAGQGAEALILCQTRQTPIHLLLTDVVMPQLGGKDLADRVAAHQPQMRVLFMSGYSDEAIGHHGVLDEGTALLHKPFTPETLLRKVRETLSNE